MTLDQQAGAASLDADVIVVGCGPVGVMAALRCAQRGLSVIALDRSEEVFPLPRALGMDEEVQELFHRAGLGDKLAAHSAPLPGAEFLDSDGNQVVGIELPPGTVGPLGLPPMVAFDQPGVERFLRTAAVEAGVDMRLGAEAFAVGQEQGSNGNEHVVVKVGNEVADTELRCRWVIAADGAKSTVRSLVGLSLVDQGFDQTWLVVDATLLDEELALPRLAQQLCSKERICTFVPGRGTHRRWEFQLQVGETREDVLRNEAIRDFLAPWGSEAQLRVDRSAVYRFHATVANSFRAGNVFLAGDAAHQMPPFNGQGMCTGMRDVENLSWKLADVAFGRADSGLLDSYDEERRPHAAEQVAHSVDAGMLMLAIANDGVAALESGYGQRPFPKLEGSLFGDHALVGGLLPRVLEPAGGLPSGWVVLAPASDQAVPPELQRAQATICELPDVSYPVLDARQCLVVRPDRHIAAVLPA